MGTVVEEFIGYLVVCLITAVLFFFGSLFFGLNISIQNILFGSGFFGLVFYGLYKDVWIKKN